MSTRPKRQRTPVSYSQKGQQKVAAVKSAKYGEEIKLPQLKKGQCAEKVSSAPQHTSMLPGTRVSTLFGDGWYEGIVKDAPWPPGTRYGNWRKIRFDDGTFLTVDTTIPEFQVLSNIEMSDDDEADNMVDYLEDDVVQPRGKLMLKAPPKVKCSHIQPRGKRDVLVPSFVELNYRKEIDDVIKKKKSDLLKARKGLGKWKEERKRIDHLKKYGLEEEIRQQEEAKICEPSEPYDSFYYNRKKNRSEIPDGWRPGIIDKPAQQPLAARKYQNTRKIYAMDVEKTACHDDETVDQERELWERFIRENPLLHSEAEGGGKKKKYTRKRRKITNKKRTKRTKRAKKPRKTKRR
jgi:hypothetical protein